MSILWRKEQVENTKKRLDTDINSKDGQSQGTISPKYNLTIFTLNYDAGPVQAVRHLLESWGVKLIDHSFSPYCNLTGTCVKNLEAVNRENSFELRQALIDNFYEAHKHGDEFKDVDMFLCIDPPAICELFLPFNKSLFVLTGSRYELGHSSPTGWKMWNDKLKKIASDHRSIVATTNTYDAEYMRHFTQVSPTILPYPCQYIRHLYSTPTNEQFLLFPVAKAFKKYFMEQLFFHLQQGHFNVSIRDFKGTPTRNTITLKDTVNYQGVILIPNDASSLAMTEIYRMNIPLFVPTIQLLSRWHSWFRVITRRTLPSSRNPRHQGSHLPGASRSQMPDPNNDQDIGALSHWLQYFDIYRNPHAILFSCVQDLLHKMQSYKAERVSVSGNMFVANEYLKRKAVRKWNMAFERLLNGPSGIWQRDVCPKGLTTKPSWCHSSLSNLRQMK